MAEIPVALFCVAGGTADEVGFFTDISSENIQSCMQKNYFSAAFIAHAMLRRWVAQPSDPGSPLFRCHIVFVASTAALVGLPGYAAYTPTKAATRALADTLRQEVLLYRSRQDIRIHCSFPGTILTEAFYHEQVRKPALCKELEGSDKIPKGLSAKHVAQMIISGLKKGYFIITMDAQTALLLNNMRGPSPKDSPVWDWMLGFIAALVWPLFRAWSDRKTIDYGKKHTASVSEN